MINIRIDKSNRCNGELSLYIHFKYDINLVNIMRSQPIRYYNPDKQEWEVPHKNLQSVIKQFEGYHINIISSLQNEPETKNTKEMLNYIPKDFKFKINPFKHQIDGINYGLKYDKFLLGDEQGLGKTMQAINIAIIKKQQRNYKHCLIICGVNGLKWNWKVEIEKHSNEVGYILGTRLKNEKEYIGSMQDRFDDLAKMQVQYNKENSIKTFPYFLITNIETLRDEGVIQKLKELCLQGIINMIVVDEVHKCKDPNSIQGKHLLKLQAETMIAMTGTPLMNSPLDLYTSIKWLGYEKHSFYQFKNHYCIMGGYGGYQIMGYKHLDQLQDQFSNITLRRLKKDVLDLPEKIYTTEYVEMGPKQEKIYTEVKQEIKENIDMIKSSPNPLTDMIRLRQATGYTGILSSIIKESVKFERLDELLEEIIKSGNKAIIFSNWTSITKPLYDKYKNIYNPAIITGEVKDRLAQENKFMKDNSCKIIIGTTGAMGTGLTLTAASYVIFVDEPWNRALREQAEDRAHRIGTKDNVNIIFLLCKNTIDERIHDIVENKGQLADALIDGKITLNDKSQLVDFLLS